jgi:hypothetical protein
MTAFAPEPFATPAVSPDTATIFRRAPYISPGEYKQTPTAVAVSGLVPGGSAAENEAALAAVIMRASDWVDTICFHRADGTLAASPSTESAWVRVKDDGSLKLICNYKPVLEVDALAIGSGPNEMTNIGQEASEGLTIVGQIIQLPQANPARGVTTIFPGVRTIRGRVYAVWTYVSGYPHTALTKTVDDGESVIEVSPSVPGGASIYGAYPGTQLTIHDGEFTEVVIVSSVAGLKLNLLTPLLYEHTVPVAPSPNSIRVTAIPWVVEQACVSLTSALIKRRGSRSLTLPQSPGGASAPAKTNPGGQAGATVDIETAYELLQPFIVPVLRST